MAIFKHNRVLLQKIRREFFNNCLWYQVDGRYFQQKSFQEALLFYIFNICELNPTNNVATMIHQILKSFIFKEPEHRRRVYKQIRYRLLPVLWKDHRAIERKKQKKLTFLANELSNTGRYVEGHIVRTIVKPYIRDLNRQWSKMTLSEVKNGTANIDVVIQHLQRERRFTPPLKLLGQILNKKYL